MFNYLDYIVIAAFFLVLLLIPALAAVLMLRPLRPRRSAAK